MFPMHKNEILMPYALYILTNIFCKLLQCPWIRDALTILLFECYLIHLVCSSTGFMSKIVKCPHSGRSVWQPRSNWFIKYLTTNTTTFLYTKGAANYAVTQVSTTIFEPGTVGLRIQRATTEPPHNISSPPPPSNTALIINRTEH